MMAEAGFKQPTFRTNVWYTIATRPLHLHHIHNNNNNKITILKEIERAAILSQVVLSIMVWIDLSIDRLKEDLLKDWGLTGLQFAWCPNDMLITGTHLRCGMTRMKNEYGHVQAQGLCFREFFEAWKKNFQKCTVCAIYKCDVT